VAKIYYHLGASRPKMISVLVIFVHYSKVILGDKNTALRHKASAV
jgi:hypothetical protein